MSIVRPLFQAQTYRDLLFLAAGIPIAAVVLGVLIAGWTSIAVLAITPLVVPLLLGYRGVVGLVARGDASLARSLLGVRRRPARLVGRAAGSGAARRPSFLDPTFWRQQGYLLLRMTLGFAFAVGELTLIAAAARLRSPCRSGIAGRHRSYGSWHVDTLGRALLLRSGGDRRARRRRAGSRGRSDRCRPGRCGRCSRHAPRRRRPSQQRRYRRRALWIDGCTAPGSSLLTTIIWAATGAGYFWPEWVLLPLALLFAIHVVVELVVAKVSRAARPAALAIHGGVVAALFLFLDGRLGA